MKNIESKMTLKERIKIYRETICVGCDANRDNGCTYLPIIHKGSNKELICPCSICLVKGVCDDERECEMIVTYYKIMLPIKDRLNTGMKESKEGDGYEYK